MPLQNQFQKQPCRNSILILILLLAGSLTLVLNGYEHTLAQPASPIIINEFMASNGQTIADEDGDFEDWIELYNDGVQPITLVGYGLSDDPEQPFRWIFPDVIIAPGDYLLVWASGKDRTNPNQPLHTNFSISAAGEPLLLTYPDGTLLDQIGPLPVPRDISYGRQPDGSDNWYFFDQPTPDSSNNDSPAYTEILEPPHFSHQGGFFTQSFDLTISASDPDVTIIYTLDGSIPDLQNLDGRTYTYKNQYPENPGDPFGPFLTDSYQSFHYSHPLAITDRSHQPDKLTGKSSTFHLNPPYFPQEPVTKATVVRARTVKDGALPSRVATHTFFVLAEGRERYSLPVISLSMQEDALFDYYDGIYTAGIDGDAWRLANPDDPAPPWRVPANYTRRGVAWEYPVSVELFPIGSDVSAIQQDMGFRIHGGATRSVQIKTLRLYARAGYGDAYFHHPVFSDQPYTRYRRLLLRNSGNDFYQTYFRDAALQSIVSHLNFDTQAYQPAIVFINAEYWGIHNIRERYDRHYLARVYGVDSDNIDLLELDRVVVEGDTADYNDLIAYLLTHGVRDAQHYAVVQTRLDLENFRDYQIAQVYIGNQDWPENNIRYWRLKTAVYDPNAPYGHDGRWRWLMYDTDAAFQLANVGWNSLARASAGMQFNQQSTAVSTTSHLSLNSHVLYATYLPIINRPPPVIPPTFLLSELLTNETFKLDFINRFADLMNTIFLPEYVENTILAIQQNIAPEMPDHISRWRSPGSLAGWQGHVDEMIAYGHERPYHQRQHIRDQFDIAGDYTLTVNVSDPTHGYVRVNTIDLVASTPGVSSDPYPWSGIYFQGIPIELEAVPTPGYKFVGWDGLPGGTPALTTQTLVVDTAVTALFAEDLPLHYWHFNDLPTGAITAVAADHTLLDNATITYPGTGIGYMDRVNDGTSLNTQLGQPAGYGLRVRNPSTTRELHLTLPTTGHDNIILSYAAKRTDNGATHQTLYYRLSDESDWIQFDDSFTIPVDYALFTFDFSEMPEVNDNPQFAVRILFSGGNAAGSSGNNRFDNVTVTGSTLFD